MTTVHAKTFIQRSGFKTLIAGFIGVLVGYLPEIVGILNLSPPWDGIVPIFVGFVVALLKLVQEFLTQPSVEARNVPADVVNKRGDIVSRVG